jgi:hypothetical protein
VAASPPPESFRDPIDAGEKCAAPNVACPTSAALPGATDPAADPSADAAAPAPRTVCVAVLTDVGNCGACGNACTGPGATCIGGTCACTGPLFDYCAGAAGCMDVSSDNANCGACAKACDQGSSCAQGVCVAN